MNRVFLLVAALAFAGCVAPNAEQQTVTVDASSFRIFAADAPTTVYAGFPISFPIQVEGPEVASDHIGAHFWSTTPSDPTAEIGDSIGCEHTASESLAGEHTVTCTFPEAGNHTLYGHARVTQGERYDYWSTARVVKVLAPYELTIENPPSKALVGGGQFVMDITGANAISTHLGGHYWTIAPEDPTAGLADAYGCIHPEGQSVLPGTFRVDCEFAEAGEVTVYGHMRIELDGTSYDFWSEPFEVTVEARS